jgi:glutamate-1-semialdehyde 2,1-aminomutase
VLVGGYHGWHDWYIGTTTRNRGVPQASRDLTATFAFNDLADLEKKLNERGGQVAAVVLEPCGAETPDEGYLQDVVDLVRARGSVCIFDEIITGFRLAPGGARQRYGVIPDLSCYGKALGNGMPISAVAGSWEAMRPFEEVFFSGTHGGEALSLAAAAAVLDTLADGTVLAGIAGLGQRMFDGIASRIGTHQIGDRVRVGGDPSRAVVGFAGSDHLVVKSWVQQCLIESGVLFNGSMFICARHTVDDVDRALAAFDTAFTGLAGGADVAALLKGPPVAPVFRTP